MRHQVSLLQWLSSPHYLRLPASLDTSYNVREGLRFELIEMLGRIRYRAINRLGSPIYYIIMINETDRRSSIHGSYMISLKAHIINELFFTTHGYHPQTMSNKKWNTPQPHHMTMPTCTGYLEAKQKKTRPNVKRHRNAYIRRGQACEVHAHRNRDKTKVIKEKRESRV